MKKLIIFAFLLFQVMNISTHSEEQTTINTKKDMKKALILVKKSKSEDLAQLAQPDLDKKIEQLVNMQREIENIKASHEFGSTQEYNHYTNDIVAKTIIINTLWPIYKNEIDSLRKK